jgi:hypothetical protein
MRFRTPAYRRAWDWPCGHSACPRGGRPRPAQRGRRVHGRPGAQHRAVRAAGRGAPLAGHAAAAPAAARRRSPRVRPAPPQPTCLSLASGHASQNWGRPQCMYARVLRAPWRQDSAQQGAPLRLSTVCGAARPLSEAQPYARLLPGSAVAERRRAQGAAGGGPGRGGAAKPLVDAQPCAQLLGVSAV